MPPKKKAKVKVKKTCVDKTKGVKVIVNSTKYFKSQPEARRYAIQLLEAGLTFLNVEEWHEQEDC